MFALVEHFQLDDDTAISVEIDHVIGALWCSIFVTRKSLMHSADSDTCHFQDVDACSLQVGVTWHLTNKSYTPPLVVSTSHVSALLKIVSKCTLVALTSLCAMSSRCISLASQTTQHTVPMY